MKKQRVAIVTIISQNYGNRLQNFALQYYLESMGMTVETIPVFLKYNKVWRGKYILRLMLQNVRKDSALCWDRFNSAIHWSKYIVGKNNKELSNSFDFFIAGSDQIWNPLFEFNSDREFLTFARPEQKIAYAGSIGLSELPENQIERFQRLLSSFSSISVREDAAAEIIQGLVEKPVEVVVDPTLLLEPEVWGKAAQKGKQIISGDYVLTYFLGECNPEYQAYIESQAAKMNCKIFRLTDGHNGVSGVGPYEFLRLIRDSKCVFTDSFHGTIFSIVFHRPFLVFDRPNQNGYGRMNSRLDTLLSLPSLAEHRICDVENLRTVDYNCSYDAIDAYFEQRRRTSREYLQQSLNRKDLK